MIKPLKLGDQNFPVNLIQGPLAGISCAPFRRLVWQYSNPAYTCTEMISCKTLIYQASLHKRFVSKHPAEGPVCFQLSSSHPPELAKATQIATDYGADLIDLNCGCPVKKIRSKGAGSSLLMQPNKLYQLIVAMKQHTHVPVGIKIRVEGNSSEKFHEEIIKVVNEGGADFLIVHGRHWTEHYETPCRYDDIAFFVENLTIPVIGNGDVACIDSLKKMLNTGCAGVMIARAGVGQPWLIKQLITEMQGATFAMPSPSMIGQMFMQHVQDLALLLGNEEFAIIQARKFAKYYGRTLENKKLLCEKINSCDSLQALEKLCSELFA